MENGKQKGLKSCRWYLFQLELSPMLAKPLLLDQEWISKVTSLCVAVQAGTDAMRADSKLEKALKLELAGCGSMFMVHGAARQGSASKGSVLLSCKQ